MLQLGCVHVHGGTTYLIIFTIFISLIVLINVINVNLYIVSLLIHPITFIPAFHMIISRICCSGRVNPIEIFNHLLGKGHLTE